VLDDAVKQTIRDAYRTWLASRGLEPRTGQRRMIAHIANALARSGDPARGLSPLCAVEAGTGTGKTIAYAVAAVPIARALGKKLVISTATVALQEQLVYRDLPDLQSSGALDFRFVLAKGRGRYVCPARLEMLVRAGGTADAAQMLLLDAGAPAAEALALYRAMQAAWAGGEWAGDRDAWPAAIPEARWAAATTDHHQCGGRRCSYVAECPFFRARGQLDGADCVVANHDLVLADIALGGGAVLPAPEDTIYVFDEAHHLPEKACAHWSHHARIGLAREQLAEGVRLAVTLAVDPTASVALRRQLGPVAGLAGEIDALLRDAAARLQELLPGTPRANGTAREYRLPHGQVPAPVIAIADPLHNALARLAAILEDASEELGRALESGGALAQERYAALGLWGGRTARLAALWRAWAVPDPADAAPMARWLRLEARGAIDDLEVAAAPVLAAGVLREGVWSRAAGAVLTSATLTALGRFDRLVMRTGLPEDSVFECVPSPFDYAGRACLAVPRLAADPGDPAAHTHAVVDWLEANLDPGEASLVLFASRRQMREVYDAVTLGLRDRVLLQDHFGKQQLLRLHRERIDAGNGSVIFGLASFAEGIDLPGRYCTHVVIAKLPFAVPDDPIEAALAEWVEARGGNAFMEISVPDAALRLVQASGRLLRTEEDSGRITLLDRRVVTKHYGRRILDSLPPFRREVA
jgi:ATP-dependent DNA helicase DinG